MQFFGGDYISGNESRIASAEFCVSDWCVKEKKMDMKMGLD
jgi:hypothetical protein